VEGDGGDVGVGKAGHGAFDGVGGLVVEDVVPEPAVLAVGQQDADLGLAVGEVAGYQFDGGPG
jgi:hypothetical protein